MCTTLTESESPKNLDMLIEGSVDTAHVQILDRVANITLDELHSQKSDME